MELKKYLKKHGVPQAEVLPLAPLDRPCDSRLTAARWQIQSCLGMYELRSLASKYTKMQAGLNKDVKSVSGK